VAAIGGVPIVQAAFSNRFSSSRFVEQFLRATFCPRTELFFSERRKVLVMGLYFAIPRCRLNWWHEWRARYLKWQGVGTPITFPL
jgi:hypothetical protein